jgi:hypothetical protein
VSAAVLSIFIVVSCIIAVSVLGAGAGAIAGAAAVSLAGALSLAVQAPRNTTAATRARRFIFFLLSGGGNQALEHWCSRGTIQVAGGTYFTSSQISVKGRAAPACPGQTVTGGKSVSIRNDF